MAKELAYEKAIKVKRKISDGNFFEIKNFKSKLFDSDIDLVGIYRQKEKLLSGNILVKDLKLEDWFKEKKFSLIDGDLDLRVIFSNKIFFDKIYSNGARFYGLITGNMDQIGPGSDNYVFSLSRSEALFLIKLFVKEIFGAPFV